MAAPGAPGAATGWGPGRKQAFGAAPGPASRLWFTIAQGNLSEVFYPRVDRPFLLGLRFLVGAAGAPPIDDAGEAVHSVTWLEPGLPAFRVVSEHAEYSLTKEFVLDPESDALLIAVSFKPEMPDVRLYLEAETHGRADGYMLASDPPSLFASRDRDWVAVVGPFGRCSVGYRHASDILVDLHDNDGVMTAEHPRAEGGYPGLGAEIGLTSGSFQMALGFAGEPELAEEIARDALARGARGVRDDLAAAWRALPDPDRGLLRVAPDGGALARCSLTLLRSLEDRANPGAFICAPTAPWGVGRRTHTRVRGRELYHITSALLAAGDPGPARRALRFLERTQLPDGSWPGAMTTAGDSAGEEAGLEPAAFPILLAWRLGVTEELDHDPWADLVRRAAAHLIAAGPITARDRWGDGGLSPSTLAVAIAALVAAAEFAGEAGDDQAAAHLLAVADHWDDRIEDWTYLRAFRHYVRLAAGLERGALDEDQIGLEFLELARRGLRDGADPRLRHSLTTADVALEVPTPAGPAWRRFGGDTYGERADGGPWTAEGGGAGHPWPLLSAERALFELAAGGSATAHLRAMEAWAGPEMMLPEQIWEGQDVPERGLRAGRATGGPAPLALAHAEYITVLAALAAGNLPDRVEPAHRRYAGAGPPEPPPVWSAANDFKTWAAGRAVLIQLPGRGGVRWTADGWATSRAAAATDTRLGCWVSELPVQDVAAGQVVEWVPAAPEGGEGRHSLAAVAAGD